MNESLLINTKGEEEEEELENIDYNVRVFLVLSQLVEIEDVHGICCW